jgi:hypothetical protein
MWCWQRFCRCWYYCMCCWHSFCECLFHAPSEAPLSHTDPPLSHTDASSLPHRCLLSGHTFCRCLYLDACTVSLFKSRTYAERGGCLYLDACRVSLLKSLLKSLDSASYIFFVDRGRTQTGPLWHQCRREEPPAAPPRASTLTRSSKASKASKGVVKQ